MKPRRLAGKIHPATNLLRRVRRPLVFTNGCFDLLHEGHVRYLEKARALGASLVVAVNSDASVRRLKGPGRPVNPLAARLKVIAALESVDFVTWFGDPTPLRLIRLLKPDVLVKGGDYTVATTVGAEDVLARGGRVELITLVKGRSTTRILRKAKAARFQAS